MSEQARTEQLRKQELASQLDQFRKAQYEAENAGSAEALENIPKVEDIVPGGWNASGRKRKKPTTNEGTTSAVGLKIRKMSSTLGVRPKEPQIDNESKPQKAKEVATPDAKSMETETPKQAAKMDSVSRLLGLVTYSSDDDD